MLGYSLGANLLVKLLGELGANAYSDFPAPKNLIAGAAISNPFDLFESTNQMNTLYSRILTKNLRKYVEKHKHVLEQKFNIERILQTKTIVEFDHVGTSQMFGYKSGHDYYSQNSSLKYIHNVNIPLLCLNAIDDPISYYKIIPYHLTSKNGNLIFAITKHGGHLGFLEGLWPRYSNFMDRLILQFINAVIDTHLKKSL